MNNRWIPCMQSLQRDRGPCLLPSFPSHGNHLQSELFDTCGIQELVEAALDGYSVTIFAFGQTGSGKTHTMVGPRLSRAPEPGTSAAALLGEGAPDPEDGLVPRCIQTAYESIGQRQGETDFSVTATCIELYNESVTDLLGKDTTKQLQVWKVVGSV